MIEQRAQRVYIIRRHRHVRTYVATETLLPAADDLRLVDIESYLPGDLLPKSDLASMAVSLELRSPFLDHRVVELGLALPDHLKRHGREGKIALRRGPLVYSFEQADNAVALDDVVLPRTATFKTQFDAGLAGGVVKLTTEGLLHKAADWNGRLYQPMDVTPPTIVPLTAVPYAIWGNRGLGKMVVWVDSSM